MPPLAALQGRMNRRAGPMPQPAGRGDGSGAIRPAGPVAGQEWKPAVLTPLATVWRPRGAAAPVGAHATTYTFNSTNAYPLKIAGPGAVEISGMTAAGVARVAVIGLPTSGRPAGNGEPYGFQPVVDGTERAVLAGGGGKATRPGGTCLLQLRAPKTSPFILSC